MSSQLPLCLSSSKCHYARYGSSANLSSLPLDLPVLPKSYVRYSLDYSNNSKLRRLEHRPYFANTSALDVSNCGLTEIDLGQWESVSHMTLLNIRGNKLHTFFSNGADTVNISGKLFAGGNPWRCSCANSWMIGWLQSLSKHLSEPGDMHCNSPSRLYGINILKSTEEDFCVDPVKRAVRIGMSTLASAASLVIIAGLCVYTWRVKCHKIAKFHPFDRDECEGEEMDYDVYLCCSSESRILTECKFWNS